MHCRGDAVTCWVYGSQRIRHAPATMMWSKWFTSCTCHLHELEVVTFNPWADQHDAKDGACACRTEEAPDKTHFIFVAAYPAAMPRHTDSGQVAGGKTRSHVTHHSCLQGAGVTPADTSRTDGTPWHRSCQLGQKSHKQARTPRWGSCTHNVASDTKSEIKRQFRRRVRTWEIL
jgi:hypothetical protein